VLDHERPMAEQDVDLLRAANLYHNSMAPAYELKITSAQKNKIKAWLAHYEISLQNKLIVIHASSRWKFKEIPMTTWAKIIDELKSMKMNVVLSGSSDDANTNKIIYGHCQSKPLLTQNFSLKDTAALYSMADLVITIDSMSTHLASALKSPVISIFGPTNERNWGPWKGKYKVIGLSAEDADIFACRPCGMDGCEGSKISQCLVQMDPQKVVLEAIAILK
jgi:heptosyltransferase-3